LTLEGRPRTLARRVPQPGSLPGNERRRSRLLLRGRAAAGPRSCGLLPRRERLPARQGAGHARRPPPALPGRVAALRRFFFRAASPISPIAAATVFLLTAQPASCGPAVITGGPRLPPCSQDSRRIPAFSRSRRPARGGSLPSRCVQHHDRDTPSARHGTAAGMPCPPLREAANPATATGPSPRPPKGPPGT
jgi:hypothetical protein